MLGDSAMDCDTIDQAQRTQLPSEVVQPTRADSASQQGECQVTQLQLREDEEF